MGGGETLDRLLALGDRSRRRDTVAAVASAVGADELLLLVRDPVVGVPVPAPGLPKTVDGGRSWRDLLANLTVDGRVEAEVELPRGTHRRAVALTRGAVTAVLVGGEPTEEGIAELDTCLPILSALLVAEQHAELAQAEARASRQAEAHARGLATALETARAEAAALNARLRSEHEHKDMFLAMLGHELRNPLAPLVTALDILSDCQRRERPVPQQVIDMMTRQTEQLTRLVEDLLDVSRVSRGHIELKRERVTVKEILRGALEASRPLIDAREQSIDLYLPDEALVVHGDRARLIQVFGNLLNNAAKYSDEGGTIEIVAACRDGRAEVQIRDEGIGIERDMLAQVFDLFTQAPGALDRAQGGLGIGLTLVRRLVELHGGEVVAESSGKGRGSTFTVSLPLADTSRMEEHPQMAEPVHDAAALRVLIVDDNRDAANSMAELLRLMGHQVSVAYDGRAPLAMPEVATTDVFMLDIGLPGMNGYQLAAALRPLARPDARFIAVTGYGVKDGRTERSNSGFDARLVKPVSLAMVRRVLASDTSRAE